MATQTIAFLFADLEGSTAMLQRLGNPVAWGLADHRLLIRAGLAAHGG
jgi:class 3 adenylate cyclase